MKILAIGDFQGVFPKKLKERIKKEDFDVVFALGDYAGIEEWKPFIIDVFKRLKKGKERIPPEEFFGEKMFKELLKRDWAAAKNVLREINKIGKPVYAVFGNGDDEFYSHPYYGFQKRSKRARDFLKTLKNVKALNYSKASFKGFDLIGFGGYMDIEAYFKKKTFKVKDDIRKRKKIKRDMSKRLFSLLKKSKKQKKIFLFHYPPYGIFDIIQDKRNPMDGESAGVKFYSKAIRKYKPAAVFCGHMHEYSGMKNLHKVPVINPGDGEKGKAAIVEISDNGKVSFKKLN